MTMKFLASMLLLTMMTTSTQAAEWPWQPFESNKGAFKAEFPGEPTATHDTIKTEAGDIAYHSYMTEVEGGSIAMGVSYNEYSDAVLKADPKVVLDGGRDGAMSNLNGKLISETDISLNGHPGREFTVTAGKGDSKLFYHTRVFLVKKKLYQLQVVRVGQTPLDAADVVRFFASFKLTN